MNSPKKSTGIDLIKFLMALVVVGIHTHPFESISNEFILKTWTIITKVSVPYFFIASGYLLFSKVFQSNNELQKQQIKTYTVKIIKLFLVWTVIYLPITIWCYLHYNGAINKMAVFLLKRFLFFGGYYFSGPLWYLLSMIYALLIIKLFYSSEKKISLLFVIAVFLFFISILIDLMVQNKIGYRFIEKPGEFLKLQFGSGRMFTGMLYMMIGAYISRMKKNIPLKYIILTAGLGVLIQLFYIRLISDVIFLVLPSVLFYLSLKLNFVANQTGYFLRKSSTVIYFSHMIVIFIYTHTVKKFPYYGFDIFLISAVIPLLFTFLIVEFEHKIPILKRIF